MNIVRLAGLIVGLCVIVVELNAQVENSDPWHWAHFTVASGLQSNHIMDVEETGDGIVWALTISGLSWYDGFRWRPADTTMGLPSDRVESIQCDREHRLLVRGNHKLYAGDRSGFTLIDVVEPVALASLPDGSILIQRQTSLALLRDGKEIPSSFSTELTEGKTIGLWETRGGSIWGNFSAGMYRLEENGWKKKIECTSRPGVANFVEENEHGTGITYFTLPFEKRGLWEWYNHSTPVRNTHERPDNVRSLDVGPNDEAVVTYESGDVKIRDKGVWSPLRLENSDVYNIRFVKFRSNGDLWIGGENGLFLYKRSSSRWRFMKHDSPDLRNYANELLRARDGSLWVATSDGIEIHRTDNSIQYVTQIDGKPLYVVTGLEQAPDGTIWATSGSSFTGAYRWDGSRWTHVEIGEGKGGIFIHKVRKDHEGRIWFLGMGSNFLSEKLNEPGAFLLTAHGFVRWGEEEGLLNGRVYSFAEGRDGALWFGTGEGMSRWTPHKRTPGDPDVRQGTWRHWTMKEGLRSRRIFTIAIDSAGRPWFGDPATIGVGIGYIDPQDTVHYITVADGLVNDYIWDLNADEAGTLWVATGNGLCSYRDDNWSTFDRESGLRNPALWPVLPFGSQVYVGTRGGGVAILDVHESNTPPPRIELDAPTLEGHNVILHWRAFAYWGELDPPEIITRSRISGREWSAWSSSKGLTLVDLEPGTYSYQVQARGLFGNYLKEGVVGTFSVPQPLFLRPAFLIPTGILLLAVVVLGGVLLLRKRKHDLDLRKSEEKFRTVTEMTSSAIFIHRNFQIVFVNSGAERLTGFSQAELLAMRFDAMLHEDHRREFELEYSPAGEEANVPRRQEAQIMTHTGEYRWVDCSTGLIRFQGEPVWLVTAFDITDRKEAEGKLRSLASELSLTEERERRRMATYLHDVIGQTLALSKMKIGGLQKAQLPVPQQESLQDIRELIDQSITNTQTLTFELCPPILYELSFEAAIEWLTERMHAQQGLAIEFRDDRLPKPMSEDIRVMLFQAVREVLVNIVKHARASHAVVMLARRGATISIDITDDGIGMNASRARNASLDGGGFGLFNIRERLSYLGAKLEIASGDGSGTRVSIVAPLQLTEE